MYIATVGTAVVSCARFKTRFICISRTRTGRHRGANVWTPLKQARDYIPSRRHNCFPWSGKIT